MDSKRFPEILDHVSSLRLPVAFVLKESVLASGINPYIFRANHKGVYFLDLFISYVGGAGRESSANIPGLPTIAKEHHQAHVTQQDYGRFGELFKSSITGSLPKCLDQKTLSDIDHFLTVEYFNLANDVLRLQQLRQSGLSN